MNLLPHSLSLSYPWNSKHGQNRQLLSLPLLPLCSPNASCLTLLSLRSVTHAVIWTGEIAWATVSASKSATGARAGEEAAAEEATAAAVAVATEAGEEGARGVMAGTHASPFSPSFDLSCGCALRFLGVDSAKHHSFRCLKSTAQILFQPSQINAWFREPGISDPNILSGRSPSPRGRVGRSPSPRGGRSHPPLVLTQRLWLCVCDVMSGTYTNYPATGAVPLAVPRGAGPLLPGSALFLISPASFIPSRALFSPYLSCCLLFPPQAQCDPLSVPVPRNVVTSIRARDMGHGSVDT
eukprot:586640-Rhodomonas_salina.3